MSLDQLTGILRAILAALAGYLISRGIGTAALFDLASSGILSAAVVIWSWRANTLDLDKVLGFVRNAMALVGGLFVQRGLLSADQVTQLSGVAATIVPALWSAYSKRPAA